jgi:ABC-type sulfate transport system substrate-binding protein
VARIYRNVKVLDSGARGSTTTFAQRGIGDVYISWENEAYLLREQLGRDRMWTSSRRWSCSRSTSCSAAGRKAQKTHFDDGGTHDRIFAKSG